VRLPRPRFTVRRMMVAVAIMAAVLGAGKWLIGLERRRGLFLDRASSHRATVRYYASRIALLRQRAAEASHHVAYYSRRRVPHFSRQEAEEQRRCYEAFVRRLSIEERRSERKLLDHIGLARKYERAAARPWLDIPPDPPMPD